MDLLDARRRRPRPPTAYKFGRSCLEFWRVIAYSFGTLLVVLFVAAVPYNNLSVSLKGAVAATIISGLIALLMLLCLVMLVELIRAIGTAIFDIADYSASLPVETTKPTATPPPPPVPTYLVPSPPLPQAGTDQSAARLLAQVQAEEEAKARSMRRV